MNIYTRILHDLLKERDDLDRAIDALEPLATRSSRGKRRGPGRPPLPLSLRRRRGRRRGPGRPPLRRGPGRPPKYRGPGRPPKRRGPGRPPKVETPAVS